MGLRLVSVAEEAGFRETSGQRCGMAGGVLEMGMVYHRTEVQVGGG
jgi:hypothetical protein